MLSSECCEDSRTHSRSPGDPKNEGGCAMEISPLPPNGIPDQNKAVVKVAMFAPKPGYGLLETSR
jgi:hypothetical protein